MHSLKLAESPHQHLHLAQKALHSYYSILLSKAQETLCVQQQYWIIYIGPQCSNLCCQTPDLDNCIKLILDALQEVCYKNDFLVAQIDAAKVYDHTQLTWKQENSGCTIIKISEIEESISQDGCNCLSCKYKSK